jgi:hypothetical protein
MLDVISRDKALILISYLTHDLKLNMELDRYEIAKTNPKR